MQRFLIALLPALILLSTRNPFWAASAFIVLGQGHFFLTYLYQWRAGKVTRTYKALYLIIATVLFLFAVSAPFSVLMTITAFVFSLHYFYDEARILEGTDTAISFTLLMPPVLFFNSYLFYTEFSIDAFLFAFTATIGLFTLHTYRFGIRSLLQLHILILNALGLCIALMYVLGASFSSEELLGAIIIHHYGTWYIHQYFKLKNNTERLARYIHDVLVVNFILISLYTIHIAAPQLDFLDILFTAQFFYVWTLLHIFFASHQLIATSKQRIARILSTVRKTN